MSAMSDMNAFNQQVIEEFRANEGVVGGMFEGAQMLLLTTTGAKSGKTRVTPLVCLPTDDPGLLYIFASKAGAPDHPAWYHNLTAHPDVVVERGTERFDARATELTGAERDEVYARQAAIAPQFAEYQKKTTRLIPVVELRRR